MNDLLPQVKEFLAAQPLKMYIGGKWADAADGKTFETRDPGTGQVIARVAAGDAEDVDRAVQAAAGGVSKSGWATMPANDRSVILHRLADLIDKHKEIIAQIESLDSASRAVRPPRLMCRTPPNPSATTPILPCIHVVARPIAVSGFDARTVRVPYGVCGFIFPWNFPFLLVGWGIAPALAAEHGRHQTRRGYALVHALLRKTGGGSRGSAGSHQYRHRLRRDCRCGSIATSRSQTHVVTGSPEVGRMIAEACGRNLVPVKLELGGKGAAMIFDDVNVDAVATALAGRGDAKCRTGLLHGHALAGS